MSAPYLSRVAVILGQLSQKEGFSISVHNDIKRFTVHPLVEKGTEVKAQDHELTSLASFETFFVQASLTSLPIASTRLVSDFQRAFPATSNAAGSSESSGEALRRRNGLHSD